MKVKIKHVQQPQLAHKIELPSTASLGDTCAAVCGQLAFGEGVDASNVSLSLNKKDPIQGDDSSLLSSLGICSGDLLWVLAPPLAAVPAPPAPPAAPEAAAAVAAPLTDLTTAAAAAAPASAGPTAMEIDAPADTTRQQEQQQFDPAATAAAGVGPVEEDHSQLHGLDTSELLAAPSRPWIPDSLLQLLTSAAAAAAALHQQQPQQPQQQQQQDAPLNPAQVLMLTAHAALLECGFLYTPPAGQHATDAAGGCSTAGGGPTPPTAIAAGAGAPIPSGSNRSSEVKEGQELQQLLRGPGGFYSVSYSLPAAEAGADAASGATGQTLPGGVIELRGMDMGQHLVLVGALKHPAPAAAAAGVTSSSSGRTGKVVATISLLKSQITAAAATAAAASPHPPLLQPRAQPQQQSKPQQQQQQQQQQPEAASYPVCAFQDLPRLWVQLKDGLGLPLLLAGCAAAGLPPPVGLNSLTYDLQEAVLGLLEAKDLAALCCSCTPMKHRASTDNLWKPLFDKEFPLPADQQQAPQPSAQQQQQPPHPARAVAGAVRAAPAAATAAASSSGSTAGASSSTSQQPPPPQQQQQQEPPLHARLAYLLSHGQRYSLRHSLAQLRQEAGRRGWKWAFGAAWTQRARLLAEAERNRRLGPMPLHRMPPHPTPMPWGPLRPRQPMMPPNIIGGDYDRFPNIAGGGAGFGMPGGLNLGGMGFSGGGLNPDLPGLGFGGGGGAGVGSGGALFSSGGVGGALGAAGPMPAGPGGGFRGGGPPGMPGFGGGRRGGSSSSSRLY